MLFPSPLVSVEWLSSQLGTHDVAVLEASVSRAQDPDGRRLWTSGRAAFVTNGHIPGARFADLITDFSDPTAALAFTRADPRRFAAAVDRLGIGPDTPVVVYDRTDGIWAARLWWQFRTAGRPAAVLDGGLAVWQAGGLPVETGEPAAAVPETSEARHIDGLWVDRDTALAIAEGRRPGTLVCALRPPVFAGAENNYGRPGHIPGSLNLPHARLLASDGRWHGGEALTEALGPLLTAPGPIVAYCGGGITAAGTALALVAAGRTDVAIYDGSLSEWAADPALPLATLDC